MSKTKELVLAGLFIAFGYVLPMIFHMFSMGGPTFLPMHIPILIAGLILSPKIALIIGIITPIFSSFFTGMPPLYPMLPIMVVELAVYGFIAALCVQKFNLNYYISLIIAMLVGRIGAGLVVAVLAVGFNLNMHPINYVLGAIITGIPGILIQLVVIPPLVYVIKMLGIKIQGA